MWIKNEVDLLNTSFINIKNIDLKKMYAENIKIILINDGDNKFIYAQEGLNVLTKFVPLTESSILKYCLNLVCKA